MKKLVKKPKAFVSVMALVLLIVLAVLALAYTSAGGIGLAQTDNCYHVQTSLFQAESGLSFLTRAVKSVSLPPGTSGDAMLTALGNGLGAELNGTSNLNGGVVSLADDTITIPTISMGSDKSFTGNITLVDSATVKIRVSGTDGKCTRAVSINFSLGSKTSGFFDYGIASKSAIVLTGNASIKGANSPSEADILSATFSKQESFRLNGNCSIAGDIYSVNPDSYATLVGNIKIGGLSSSDPNITNHIHLGTDNVVFPEVDPTVFEPFATNIVNSSTSTTGNKTFTNIRIVAGTNPNFSGNITLKGVIFVEKPNMVTFTGNLNITGLIVTQDAGDNVYTQNTIKFTGNTTSYGVETLPDTTEFHDLRNMPGSFILAPGFGVTFTGNFGTVNGCMAADSFTFTGNAGGTVNGPIINYSDSDLSLTGNSSLTINRLNSPAVPPGFESQVCLIPDSTTYAEH